MLIFYIQVELKKDKRMKRCLLQFNRLKAQFETSNTIFKVITLSNSEYSYSYFLNYIWGLDDIILIEHDMFITIENMKEMLDCNYKLICSAQYNLQPIPITLKQPIPITLNIHHNRANRNTIKTKIQISRHTIIYISFPEEYCDYGAFGFVKISKEVQQNVILPFNKWNNLDSIFYELFIKKYGLKKVHNHKEVSHLHIYDM